MNDQNEMFIRMEDGKTFKAKLVDPPELKLGSNNSINLPKLYYGEFELEFDRPRCFKNYNRYLTYHLLGFDPWNIPFFRENFNFNE